MKAAAAPASAPARAAPLLRRQAAPASAPASTSSSAVTHRLMGMKRVVTVREPNSFGVEAVDDDGQRVQNGAGELYVTIRGVASVRARVVNNHDGTHSIFWRPPQSGPYSFLISRARHGPLPFCPFAIVASTPEPSAMQCVVSGEALAAATSLETNTFEVSFRDRLGALTVRDLHTHRMQTPPALIACTHWTRTR